MNPVAKHLDPVIGIDLHIVQPPGPVPPVPIPHPHVGVLMDPMDYLPYVGANVTICGIPRAQAGTGSMSMTHIPIGGTFIKPPGNEGEMFMGCSTVSADGDALSYLGLPMLSCQDVGMMAPFRMGKPKKTVSMVLPTSTVLAIPSTVTVAGAPTISLAALGARAAMAAATRMAGAVLRRVKQLRKARKARKAVNGKCADGLHPVNIVTGEQFDTFVDAASSDQGLFSWSRYYTTARRKQDSTVGYGFRHSYDHRLELKPLAWCYEDWRGKELFFEPLTKEKQESRIHDYVLRRLSSRRFELIHGDDPVLEFYASYYDTSARLHSVRHQGRLLKLKYRNDRLEGLTEQSPEGGTTEYAIYYDDRGHILEVHKHTEMGSKRVAAYGYDHRNNLTSSENAEGGRHYYKYDKKRLMTTMQDPCGYSFWWKYDEKGRCIEGAGKDGLWWGKLEYFPEKRETHVTERNGGVWIHKYDENNTIIERIDPYEGIATREVDQQGRVTGEVDSGGRSLRWLYNEDDIHYARVDDLGFIYPPEEEMIELPDPMELQAPTTSFEWSLGSELLPASSIGAEGSFLQILPNQVQQAALDILRLRPPNMAASPTAQRRFNELGHIIEEIDPIGRLRRWKYDTNGNEIWYRDADGCEHKRHIVRWNLLGTDIDPLGHKTNYEYTSTEMVSKIVDPGGTVSTYDYDEKDRLVRVSRHGVIREEYSYDQGDCLIEKRDGQGQTLLKLVYDERCLMIERHLTEGGIHYFDYDYSGNPIKASTDKHEVLISRDFQGSVRSDLVNGLGVEHIGFGSRYIVRYFGRFDVQFKLQDGTKTVRVTDPAGGVHVQYSSSDGLVVRKHEKGSSELSQYDDGGKREGTLLFKQTNDGANWLQGIRYEYTAEGDLVRVIDTVRGRTEYQVDAAHRLIGEQSCGNSYSFKLDKAGNILEKSGVTGVILAENRLRYANDETFVYNNRNHLSQRRSLNGQDVRYFYDSFDMLVRIEDDQAEAWTAEYDGLGRRLRCGRGEKQTQFFWEDERLAAEINPEGSIRFYVYPGPDARIPWMFIDYDSLDAPAETGKVYALFTNQVGVPMQVEDATGRIVWWADRVNPYGLVEVSPTSEIEVNIRWPGHYFDAETGLHYNRFRYYDPILGRYLQSDPKGQAGGINLYAYVPNPVVQVDVLGLSRHRNKGNSKREGSNSSNNEGVTEPKDSIKRETIEFNKHGGGKNAKHSNAEVRAASEKKWNEAKQRLADAKKSGSTKKEKKAIQKEIDHWKRKMDFTGENHSQKKKGN